MCCRFFHVAALPRIQGALDALHTPLQGTHFFKALLFILSLVHHSDQQNNKNNNNQIHATR